MNAFNFCFINSYFILLTVTSGSCWHYFTALVDYSLTNSEDMPQHLHSDYYYGDCKRPGLKFYTHTHLDHMDVIGKIIVRGWIDVMRIPTCTILRATAYDTDRLRSTAYNFQFCIPRIAYCHTHLRYKYHYYEWYIPTDYIGGMNWDIYFYGPPVMEWHGDASTHFYNWRG